MATETATKQLWFQKHVPEMAEQWQQFHDTVYKVGELDRKTKELIAVAASTTLRCVHCTRGHIDAAQQYGADRQEISEAIMMAGLLASGTQLHWRIGRRAPGGKKGRVRPSAIGCSSAFRR